MSKRVLVVDDDPTQRRILEETIKRFGYHVVTADGGDAALAALRADDTGDICLILLDLVMPGTDGMTVLSSMRSLPRKPPAIVQTAHGSIDAAISAMRAGAVDFVVKPVSPERLEVSIKNALRIEALAGEITRMKATASGELGFSDLIVGSETMKRVIELGKRAATSNIPVLIEGESGVGKELIARAIQGESARRTKPFVTVNCGAIPENLVESILFGHEKGSFTGAAERRPGKFLEADGGTLFLDEIGELPLDAQVKLLRALQEGEIDSVGGKQPVKVDFRLISATNQNLIALVQEGRFREGSLLPAERVPHLGAAFARALGRRAGAGAPFHGALRPPRKASVSTGSTPKPQACSSATPGPAISVSSRMRCSAPWCSPTRRC